MSFSVVTADELVERPCVKLDLPGAWKLSVSKSKENTPDGYRDLTVPYQIRVYKVDNTILQLFF